MNTIDEHLDMLMVCHHLSRSIPEDVAFAESRIRAETIGAEDVFHDRGIISMMSSDSQAMGRIGEAIVRCWQTAHKMKVQWVPLPPTSARNDNERVKRYVAKYTINPALTHGIADHVGSIESGKLADLVIYKPEYFGVKPELVLKGACWCRRRWATRTRASRLRNRCTRGPSSPRMAGRCRSRACRSCRRLRSRKGSANGTGSNASSAAVQGCRTVGKKDMIRNEATPEIRVDADTYQVWVDGEKVGSDPIQELPMAQRYFLF